jgi:hypothetical protein
LGVGSLGVNTAGAVSKFCGTVVSAFDWTSSGAEDKAVDSVRAGVRNSALVLRVLDADEGDVA